MSEELPPALATALRPALPELAQEMIAAIGREVPDYARPLEGPFGRALRVGVERALERFVDGIEDPAAGGGGGGGAYRARRRRAPAAPARSTSRSAAARCAPAAASTRCSAPTASARAWPGSASSPPAR